MEKLNVELEYCYGIKKLQAEFDFASHGDVFTIYAPNGVMKTSLANTFKDLSKGEPSSDRVWPNNETKRVIVDENGDDLAPQSVFVIEPYDEGYRSERISTLLVNEELRKRYELIHKDIDQKAQALSVALKPFTGLRSGILEEFADSITHDRDSFFTAIGRVRREIEDGSATPLGDVTYADIFNPKVDTILQDQDFRSKIEEIHREVR